MNKDGSFDYSKDKYAVNMMKKSLSLGNIDTLIFFANSPQEDSKSVIEKIESRVLIFIKLFYG